MKRLRPCAPLIFLLLSSVLLFSEDKPWTEVRSPHFRLVTNGSEHDARHVLHGFELMRAVFEGQFPGFKLDAPAPLLIFAPKDEYTAKQLLPQFWAHDGTRVAGLYHHGWEREYAVVRLDTLHTTYDPDEYATVYHEYIHSLLHINFRWLPSWLDEGLAQFYSFTRFEKGKILIGAPPQNARRFNILREKNSVPLEKFFQSRMLNQDADQTYLLYMQAWAMTHYLTFGEGMQNGQLLRHFFNELQHGTPQKKAFIETFGPLQTVQAHYDEYIHKFLFTSYVLPLPSLMDEKQFPSRAMSLAETHAELAAWHIRFHHWEQVREYTEAALKEDPKLSLAHEDNGFLQFNDGKDDEALKEFSAAAELDPKNYIALFAKTMSSAGGQAASVVELDARSKALEHVLELKREFAPAYVELAKIYLKQGNLQLALGLSRKAEQLEPFRAGYHILSGEILLLMNRPTEAAAEGAYVADRWAGPDRDEALELWNKVPEAQRGSEPLTVDLSSPTGQVTEGIVKLVTCGPGTFTMTLDVNGQSQTFKRPGFVGGFSDTLWVGRDHFSPCFHVQGLRANVHYTPAKDSSYTGDLIYAGFRDDLGAPSAPAAARASAR